MLFGVVTVANVESPPQETERIAVGVLAPSGAVCNPHKLRIVHVKESQLPDIGAPDAVQYFSIGGRRYWRHVMAGDTRRTVSEVVVEHLVAGAR